ncbi:hypothetical protein K435DRAFT_859131 [Dendrothele bispora CBS 962.96]|uniref:Uncharacterized protein n=1 Tax=Dendrothele bispora (strain CBS 962.96) TaxID=1314807 RepID=A0A4V4HFQ5_DENBC|nr:hypothetical protein K435DRAFT_859131 [Dendrothele bispora CBS 962.96]
MPSKSLSPTAPPKSITTSSKLTESVGGVCALGGASRGCVPFNSTRIITPPTSDGLNTETRNQQCVQQQDELQEEPQNSTRTVEKQKRAYSSIANALSKHELSDQGRGRGSAPRGHVSAFTSTQSTRSVLVIIPLLVYLW